MWNKWYEFDVTISLYRSNYELGKIKKGISFIINNSIVHPEICIKNYFKSFRTVLNCKSNQIYLLLFPSVNQSHSNKFSARVVLLFSLVREENNIVKEKGKLKHEFIFFEVFKYNESLKKFSCLYKSKKSGYAEQCYIKWNYETIMPK